MGAGQGLQPAVPLAYGLPAQAAVELRLLHALVEAHDVGTQLPLQPLAAVDALAQTVQLQLAQLGPRGQACGRRGRDQVSAGEQLSRSPCPAQEAVLESGCAGSSPGHVPAWLMDLEATPCPLWALVSPHAELGGGEVSGLHP